MKYFVGDWSNSLKFSHNTTSLKLVYWVIATLLLAFFTVEPRFTFFIVPWWKKEQEMGKRKIREKSKLLKVCNLQEISTRIHLICAEKLTSFKEMYYLVLCTFIKINETRFYVRILLLSFPFDQEIKKVKPSQ